MLHMPLTGLLFLRKVRQTEKPATLPGLTERIQKAALLVGLPSQKDWVHGALCFFTPQISYLSVLESREGQKPLMTVTG